MMSLLAGLRAPVRSSIYLRSPRDMDLFQYVKSIPAMIRIVEYRDCSCSSAGSHKVTYKPYVPIMILDHDRKNMMLGRPMSPHLDIYGPTVPAMTSIAQRATGIMLTMYSIIMAGGSLFLPKGIHSIVHYIQSLNLPEMLIIGIKAVIAISFTFHYFIGIRFVMFNLGKWLNLKEAYSTAYLSIVLCIVTGIAAALIGHFY